MKTVTATLSMLMTYEHRHKQALKCFRCGEKIKENEKCQKATHSNRYYCEKCTKEIEI